jgi:hypothetical protein
MSTHIDTFSINEKHTLENQLENIRNKYRNFLFDLRYILIETGYTHRLLKNKPYNVRKLLENDPRVIITETDLYWDPEIKYVPIIKNASLYQTLMKDFDGYVAFHYSGPLEEMNCFISYLREFGYCNLCSPENIYEIRIYEVETKEKKENFLFVRLHTDF